MGRGLLVAVLLCSLGLPSLGGETGHHGCDSGGHSSGAGHCCPSQQGGYDPSYYYYGSGGSAAAPPVERLPALDPRLPSIRSISGVLYRIENEWLDTRNRLGGGGTAHLMTEQGPVLVEVEAVPYGRMKSRGAGSQWKLYTRVVDGRALVTSYMFMGMDPLFGDLNPVKLP